MFLISTPSFPNHSRNLFTHFVCWNVAINFFWSFFFFVRSGPAPTVPTITYTVGDRDTLTSVAARFDTTPSELTALNRLGSSFIYSGQTLLVPDKSQMKDEDSSSETSGDTDGSKDKSRKSSSNNDDIPQQEKGRFAAYRSSASLLLFLRRRFEGQKREKKVYRPTCRTFGLILLRTCARARLVQETCT